MNARHYGTGLSDEEKREILDAFRAGAVVNQLAAQYGVNKETIKRVVDPEFAARRNAQNNLARWMRRHHGSGKAVNLEQDAGRLMRQVPRDTRDLTGRLCGDPLPGRSALDRMREGDT